MTHSRFFACFCALAALFSSFLALQPLYAAESTSIYGIHDHDPDPGEFLTHLENAGMRGWVTATVAVGHDPSDTGGADFSAIADRGHTVICRINNGYGTDGCIPVPSQYDNFATRCASFAANSKGCGIWVIGNETNLNSEWPVENGYRKYLSPQDYAVCFRKCYNAIKAVRPNDKVVSQALATWGGPYGGGTVGGYPADGMPLNWVQYLNQMLTAIASSGPLDGIALHIGSRGYTCADIHSTAQINAGGQNLYWSFYVYKDWVNLGIPPSLYNLPLYATECNGMFYWKGGHPEDPSKHYEAGWVREMYAEINRYNQIAIATGKPVYRCVNLYRWCSWCDGWNIDGSDNPYKGQILSDLDAALSQHYTWPSEPMHQVVDNTDPGFSVVSGATHWQTSTASEGQYGVDYRVSASGAGENVVKWTPNLTQPGFYKVYVWYPQGTDRAPDAPFTVHSLNGDATVKVDQRTGGGAWEGLGTFPLLGGGYGTVTLSNAAGASVVVADAVKWEWQEELPATGSVSGYVRDTAGVPLAGASISAGSGSYSATTGADGSYGISGMTPGSYNLTAAKTGYAPQTLLVNVGLGATAQDFTLKPVFGVLDVTGAPASVKRGQTGITLQMRVFNGLEHDFRVTTAGLRFWQGGTNVSSSYTVTPATNPSVIPAGQTAQFAYTVKVGTSAPLGAVAIQGSVAGFENLVPNGSFEEGAAIPPPFWENWNTGGAYAYDPSAILGTRSYRLDLSGAPEGTWVTCNTAPNGRLLPIQPGKLYHNRTAYKRSVTAGSVALALVWEEYDAAGNKIGGDHYLQLPDATSWRYGGADYTTSANAAQFRTWVGMNALAQPTTASAYFDDVLLYGNDALQDDTAEQPGTWVVTGGQTLSTIAQAKTLTDGTLVTLLDKVASASTGEGLWIQEPDRSSAVRIDGSWPGVSPGSLVTVTGTMAGAGAERALTGATVSVTGQGKAPVALAMTSAALCGAALPPLAAGADGAAGVNNVGLLVSVCGRVTGSPAAGVFCVDDGLGLNAGDLTGIRVRTDGAGTLPDTGDYVQATGIARLNPAGTGYQRELFCWSTDNIRHIAP